MKRDGAKNLLTTLVQRVQSLPYVWPSPPDAEWARTNRTGTCASKHALLAEDLSAAGIATVPLLVIGKFVPKSLKNEFPEAVRLLEVHECITAITPWAGPLRIDVTWDPPLIRSGLRGSLDWDGASDMLLAVQEEGPGWAVPRKALRATKEALRRRIYSEDDRALRDRTLRALSDRFALSRAESNVAFGASKAQHGRQA